MTQPTINDMPHKDDIVFIIPPTFKYSVRFAPNDNRAGFLFTTLDYENGVTVTDVPEDLCYRVDTFSTYGYNHSTGHYKVPSCKTVIAGDGQHVIEWADVIRIPGPRV